MTGPYCVVQLGLKCMSFLPCLPNAVIIVMYHQGSKSHVCLETSGQPSREKGAISPGRGQLSLWGPATQAFQIPYCLTLSYLEVQSDSSPRREESVNPLGWVVSVSSREESLWFWPIFQSSSEVLGALCMLDKPSTTKLNPQHFFSQFLF